MGWNAGTMMETQEAEMPLALVDWLIIAIYVLFTIAVGLYYRKQASAGLASFFVGDRSFPWWLIGISMVATTFAADTPLAITGIVAKDGVSGNWFWWSMGIAHLGVVFVVARLWRNSRVITDAEIVELRYEGRSAAVLRGFKAFFFAVVINCITMGWVIRAVGKIAHSFLRWDQAFPALHLWMSSWWPQSISIADPGEGLSILIMSFLALFYAFLGGIRSVIITDLVQFAMALVGAVVFAWFAVDHVGGLDAMVTQLHTLYPERAEAMLSFVPSDLAGGALFAFIMFVTVQWWAQHNSDGGGYFAQRICSAKDEHHATRGTLLFTLTHYLVRTWPWILVGLVALVVFPLEPGSGPISAEYGRVLADREAAYPILIGKLLPPGLVGLLVASLIAAFMSTIDTHVNWGSSYLVNDVYARFIKPSASEGELVMAGRLATVLVLILALAITTRIDSIKDAWEFFTALGAGMGLPHLLRWVWWRLNAWSELAGLTSAAIMTGFLWVFFPDLAYSFKLLWTVSVSTVLMLLATFVTRPISLPQLERFYQQVQPFGFWGPLAQSARRAKDHQRLYRALVLWATSTVLLFVSLYGLKELFVGDRLQGSVLATLCLAGWVGIARIVGRQTAEGRP
jgi:SSS family solute:Na+ symporter